MKRSINPALPAFSLLLMLLFGACSAESLAERAAEFGLEQATEGNEDIDIDFGDDGNGGFTVSTDEGEFSVSFDEDSGGITFDTDEGEGVINFDEGGITFDTDEGEGVINFDEDGITFDTDEGDGEITFGEDGVTFETSEGDGEITFDDNNGISVTTEDSTGFFGAQTIPEQWPANIGVPATTSEQRMFFTMFESDTEVVLSGSFEHDPADPYAEQVVEKLKADGWVVAFETSSPDGFMVSFEKDGATAIVTNNTTFGSSAVAFTTPA